MMWKLITKQLLVVLIIIAGANYSYAQNRNSIWVFGDSALVDFSNINNPISGISSMDGRGSCVTIGDSGGALLFYAFTRATVLGFSGQIFDKTHQLMQNGDLVAGEGWYKEMVIIPDPSLSNIYYIFSICISNSCPQGLYYSTINMNLNGGFGAVVQKNVQLFSSKTVDGLAAVKHGNGRDWWVICRKMDSNYNGNKRYFKYLVDPSGVTPLDSQAIGQTNKGDLGTLVLNSLGTQMAFVNTRGLIDVMNFNRCTGHLSQIKSIEPETPGNIPWYVGAAFSPNGNYLYVSSNGNNSALFKYDLTLPDPAIARDTLWEFTDSSQPGGLIKLAPDGKIYMSNAWNNGVQFNYPYQDTMFNYVNMNLSVINEPDQPGLACNFQPYSFYLGGKRSYYGLPNNPDYELGPLIGSPCDTLTGTGESLEFESLTIAPNPFSEYFIVNIPYESEPSIIISVYDLHGREIIRETGEVHTNVFHKRISLKEFSKGVYAIRIFDGKKLFAGKILKQ
ncbi:MAG: T9SS type A sorting domain-containing protein [Bacteroidota bacterium]